MAIKAEVRRARKKLQDEAEQIDDTLQVDYVPPAESPTVIEIRAITIVKVLAVLFGAYVVIQVWPLITLLVASIMLAAALSPYLALLERRGLNRPLALTGVALSLVLLFAGLIAVIVPGLVMQTRDLIANSDAYVRSLQTILAQHGIHQNLVHTWKTVPRHMEGANSRLLDAAVTIFDSALALATVLFVTLYLLSDQERIKSFFVGMFPAHRRVHVLAILAEMRSQVGGYVRGQMITSLLAAVFAFVVLVIAGIPNPLTLAVYVGVVDLVPLFGGMLGMIPCVLIALTISPMRAILVLIGFVIYQNLENHLIVPRVYASTLKIPSLVALVALLVGGKLLGVLGMLVALPVVAGLPVILDFAGVHLRAASIPTASPDAAEDIVKS